MARKPIMGVHSTGAGSKEEQRLVEPLRDAQEPGSVRLHPGMAQTYRRKVAGLVRALAEEDDAGTAREAIRGLIDRVVLTRQGGEGRLRIDLEGELAGILPLATEHKGDGGASDLQSQVNLVAGIGFEPMTFRL